MKTTTKKTNSSQEPSVALLEQTSLNQMGRWYDQQILLAQKSEKLSGLKASIAENRLKESYALVELARLTAPQPEAAAAGAGENENGPQESALSAV